MMRLDAVLRSDRVRAQAGMSALAGGAPDDQARAADMSKAWLSLGVELFQGQRDAFPSAIVVPDHDATFAHEAKRGVGVLARVVLGVRAVDENEAGLAEMLRPVERGEIPQQLHVPVAFAVAWTAAISKALAWNHFLDEHPLSRQLELRRMVGRKVERDTAAFGRVHCEV